MDLIAFFDEHNIAYDRVDHDAVLTTEESEAASSHMGGAGTKNLFVRDKKPRRHILIAVHCEKVVDLRAFKKLIDCPSNLSIASDKRLKQYLGIESGAVGLLAVVNDPGDIVEVYIDQGLWDSEYIRFHPLINTATIKLAQKDVERIFAILGHNYKVMEIPEKDIS